MPIRYPLLPVVGVLSLLATPLPTLPRSTSATTTSQTSSTGELPSREQFDSLIQADPIAALEAARLRYQREVRSYRTTMVKQERLGGVWQPAEEIDVLWRESPMAVRMVWKSGARKVLGTTVEGSLYVNGENGGKMTVWRPTALASFLRFYDVSPTDTQARAASRYAITESGLGHTLDRTTRAWATARGQGTGAIEYLGMQNHPKLDRPCYVLKRTCEPPELDRFQVSDAPRPAKEQPGEAIHTSTIYLDRDTWLQLGAELTGHDGTPLGHYYFRNLQLNPTLSAKDFTREAFGK
jgi:hypothetical protein